MGAWTARRIDKRKIKASRFSPGRQFVFVFFCGDLLDCESYCVGLSNWVKPVVFTSRNNGVRGGNNDGSRKLESKE